MEATIVTVTLPDGRTGNIDYRDCRIPTDKDLLQVARHYGMSKDIKYTITTTIGTKTRFMADIEDGVLLRRNTEVNNRALLAMRTAVCQQEMDHLEGYRKIPVDVEQLKADFGVTEEQITERLNKRRDGVWCDVPIRYMNEMRICILMEILVEIVQ